MNHIMSSVLKIEMSLIVCCCFIMSSSELLQAKVVLFKGYCVIDQQMICCNII
jgi:hypothetical protein